VSVQRTGSLTRQQVVHRLDNGFGSLVVNSWEFRRRGLWCV